MSFASTSWNVPLAFVLAWRHVRALREPSAWDAWLHRLTVRACYRAARKARRRDLIEVPAVLDQDLGAGGDLAMVVAQNDQLGRELRRLPIDQRAVMVLHFYVDLPLPEVAAILEIPVGTAKSRLHRGLAAMRAAMPAEPSEPVRLAQERLA